MKLSSLSFIITVAALVPLPISASAQAHESMDPVKLFTQVQKLQAQLQAKPNRCVQKCDNVGNRADACFYQRCALPFSVITCQTPILNFGVEADCCCEKTVVISKNTVKLISSLTCLIPTEMVCCPIYALCGAESAKTCLCLE